MGLGHSPSIVVDGLVFYIDPNNPNCYPGFGNTLYNIVNTSIGGTFVAFTSNPIDNTETRSIYFDGSNNFIQTNYFPYLTSDFTLEVFAKFTRYNNYQCILSSANNGGAGSGFWFEFGSDRGFTIYTTGSQLLLEDNIVSLTNLELNKWHHIVATRSGSGTSNVKLYVNNILCGQNTSNAALGHTSFALMVGKYDYVGNYHYFKGNVGSIKIYNKGLSATEILQNYNATKKKYMPEENIVTNGLVLKLDAGNINSYAGVGTVWNDLSGFGNTFYLINGPSFNSAKGGYISFDGSNDYARLHSLSTNLQSTTSFTVEMLFKFNNGNTSWKKLFGFLDTDNALEMWVEQAKFKDDTGLVSNKSFEYIDFTYMTYVVNSSEKRLYFNGVLDKSGSGYSLSLPTSYLGIASDIGRGYYCNMDVNLIQIYNRALTQQEISQNYNATKKRFVNALPPVRNGLVMELDAGQRSSYPGTGNTWYDLSGNSLNGTLTNGPTFSGIGASSSISFDGTNDYVDCGYNSTINSSTQFTIECWYKSSNISVEGILFSTNTYGSTPANGYHMEIYQSKLLFQVFPSTSSVQSSITLSNNVWYHLVSTYSSGTINLYVNTVSGGSGTYTFNSSTGNLLLGRYPQGQFSLNGQMSSIRFYNRVLSAYEVKQNFDFYRTRYNI